MAVGIVSSALVHRMYKELPPEVKELPIEDLAEKVMSLLRRSDRGAWWPAYVTHLLMILLTSEQEVYRAEQFAAESSTDGGAMPSSGSFRHAASGLSEIMRNSDAGLSYSARAALRCACGRHTSPRSAGTPYPDAGLPDAGVPGADAFSPHHPHRGH